VGDDKPTSGAIRAGGNVVKIDAGSVSAGGDININLGGTAPAKPAIISTVPTPSSNFVRRTNITAKIHAALGANPDEVVIRQAVTRAMGGYGKTVAAILYAHEYQNDYPGGRFFLSVESGELVTALASLITPLGLTSAEDPKTDAAAVSQTLRKGRASLLILDNVTNKAKWDEMRALTIPGTPLTLVPHGGCRVLITTRDDAIDPARAIPIGRLSDAEAAEIFSLFCRDRHARATNAQKRAGLPNPLPTQEIADAITNWLGGLAVAVAAVAAYMKLKPHIAWDVYWNGTTPAPGSGVKAVRGLRNTPIGELPEVRPEVAEQLGLEGKPLEDHRRTLRVIDDALAALPAAERRMVEYAALLPQDLAPRIWLESLLSADAARPATSADGTPDPLHIALSADLDDTLSPAKVVLQHLDSLDILLPGGESGQLLSLHRLWYARVNERAKSGVHDRTPLLLTITQACKSPCEAALMRSSDECPAWELAAAYGLRMVLESSGHADVAVLFDAPLSWHYDAAEFASSPYKNEGQGIAVIVSVAKAGSERSIT